MQIILASVVVAKWAHHFKFLYEAINEISQEYNDNIQLSQLVRELLPRECSDWRDALVSPLFKKGN